MRKPFVIKFCWKTNFLTWLERKHNMIFLRIESHMGNYILLAQFCKSVLNRYVSLHVILIMLIYTIMSVFSRGFTKFGIKVLWRLQFFIGYRTLDLKFQKAVSAKLRQLAGQTQDNFNFGPSLLLNLRSCSL